MQSLDVFDTVVLMWLGWLAIVHLTDCLVPILLQVGPACKISDDPSERVAKIHASSDCGQVLVWPYGGSVGDE